MFHINTLFSPDLLQSLEICDYKDINNAVEQMLSDM